MFCLIWWPDDDVHINKRTKISDPVASELDFDIKPLKTDKDLPTLTIVNDIIEHNTKSTKINISAFHISFKGSAETIQVHGKIHLKSWKWSFQTKLGV